MLAYRLVLTGLFTTLALGVLTTIALGAEGTAQPAFLSSLKNEVQEKAVSGKSGKVKLVAGETTIECKESKAGGELEGISHAQKIKLTFTGCKAKNKKEECEIKSSEAKSEGEVASNELVGELGNVAKAEATSEVGLALKPASGKVWASVKGKCLPGGGGSLEGTLIGEVVTIGKLASTNTLSYKVEAGKQKLVKFVEGTKSALSLLGSEATFEWSNELAFPEPVVFELVPEVTRSPAETEYGTFNVGEEAVAIVTYTNKGPIKWFPGTPILIGPSKHEGFEFGTDTCKGAAIAVLGKCSVEVVFDPTLPGGLWETRLVMAPAPLAALKGWSS